MGEPDVVIVGAGAAGLVAAGVVSAAGRSVEVVEARGRVGGRIHTVRDRALGIPVELGAEFIHGEPEATWRMVRRAGLTAYEVPFEHRQKRRGRLVRVPDFGEDLKKVMGGLSRLRGRDVSFADYLRGHARGPGLAEPRKLAVSFVQGFDAADPERISARSLAEEQEGLGDVEGEPQFRVLEGYGALMRDLERRLDPALVRVRLRAPVAEVCWGRARGRSWVEVRWSGGSIRGRAAIITLPLGVMQAPPEMPGSVRFAPEIPGHRRAAGVLGSGPVVKVVMSFKEAFWEREAVARSAGAGGSLRDAAFMHDPDSAFPTWWTSRPLRLPLLTAWAGGPKALALSGLAQRELIGAAVECLGGLLGQGRGRIESLVAGAHAADWPADAFARGAYSYETVGAGGARAALARPVEGTLFFAGEATDTSGQASTVAGALASGERAAGEVLRALGAGGMKPAARLGRGGRRRQR